MFSYLKTNRKQNFLKRDIKITSHEIVSIQFLKNRFKIFNLKPTYMLKYKTMDNKTYTIYSPTKSLIEAIFFKCLYFPNYKISYIKNSFKEITKSLTSGTIRLTFDHLTENGQITYIRVSNVPFASENMLNIAKSNKKVWIPINNKNHSVLSFLELIKSTEQK